MTPSMLGTLSVILAIELVLKGFKLREIGKDKKREVELVIVIMAMVMIFRFLFLVYRQMQYLG